ncbi:DsbA family protein [uncultured Roseovarius sp.]|uniref:DsbA family protein n=1 Tax=uncultured Roseovarius sp. TaxID=293344 RepID=UPI00261639B7|nr:DsbA family protein [uncultured Roseovarius sp.]
MTCIDYIYSAHSAHSAFAWLGSARLSEICARHGAHWRDDADIADPAALAPLIAGCDLDPEATPTAALSDELQAIHRANTAEAVARHVFGSPTYIVGGDPVYGQDRLDLVERALTRHFVASTWRNPQVG